MGRASTGRAVRSLLLPDLGRVVGPPTDAERRRIYLWLDANVPFYGTYSHAEQLAQREGQSIRPPAKQ